ncbi:hypothetical protein [Streptomyces sp. NPDC001835]|jgi:hypothetical protein|uniref:hypothetical protein n=1 Tax=unclassified Streptomyces TaxID=2593676 RepID=UPI00331E6B20
MNSKGTNASRFTAIFTLVLLLGLGVQSAERAAHVQSATQTAGSPVNDPEWG